jgi:membrane dipeptidase
VFAPSTRFDAPRLESDGFERAPSTRQAQSVAIELTAHLLKLERNSAGRLVVARTMHDLETCVERSAFAAVLHLEGAEAIDPNFEMLDVMYAAGLRSLGPVWSRPNRFGSGVPLTFPGHPDCGPGLTRRGQDLVRVCNELGIMVDTSHMTERGFWDVANISDTPLVASHSNAHAICPAPRNLTDRQLDAIKDSDGIVGFNLAVDFIRPDGAREPETAIDTVIGHLEYLIERVGTDHVGFGSDFDGATIPSFISDASGMSRLGEELEARGYTHADLERIGHANWFRVLASSWRGGRASL